MSDAEQQGLRLFAEIYGQDAADGTREWYSKGEGFGVEQGRWTMEWTFGTVWCREGLERKLRSCTVLGMLIAQGAAEEIRYHTRMGLKNGLSRTEIEEIFYTAFPYCGFPKAATAKRAMLLGFEDYEKQENGK
jgi:alkylhydroperoxidase/carboxymuconolactone decarboxylase family protein YurZ